MSRIFKEAIFSTTGTSNVHAQNLVETPQSMPEII